MHMDLYCVHWVDGVNFWISYFHGCDIQKKRSRVQWSTELVMVRLFDKFLCCGWVMAQSCVGSAVVFNHIIGFQIYCLCKRIDVNTIDRIVAIKIIENNTYRKLSCHFNWLRFAFKLKNTNLIISASSHQSVISFFFFVSFGVLLLFMCMSV